MPQFQEIQADNPIKEVIDSVFDMKLEYGADAIVNVRFTTSTVMQGAAEMLAYGTAVKLKG